MTTILDRTRQPATLEHAKTLLESPSAKSWMRLCDVVEGCEPEVFSSDWLPHLKDKLEQAAWREVRCQVPKRWLRELSRGEDVPWLTLCNTLAIHFRRPSYARIFSALKHQPWLLDGIESLHLSGQLTPERLEMIPGIRPGFKLHTLRIDSCQVSDHDIAQLLQDTYAQAISALRCTSCPVGMEMVHALQRASHPLRHVMMQGTSLTPEYMYGLLQAPSAPGWQHLDLSSRPAGWEPQTQRHIIEHNHLHDDALRLLAEATHVTQLESLHFSYSDLTAAGLGHLHRASHLGSLRHLDLSHSNGLTDEGLRHILHSPALQQLESLNVSFCSLSEEGLAWLNTSSALPRLKRLNTEGNLSC